MSKLSYKEFLNFLESDLDEVEYFGCNKNSLVSLREYLNELKQKNEEYGRLIQEPLESIKKKNKWIKIITPDHDINSTGLIIIGRTQPTFLVGIDPSLSKNNSNDFVRIGGNYITPFLHTKLKKRNKVLENSQNELHEINKIAHRLDFIHKNINSASDKFKFNTEYDECYIECFDWPIIKAILSTGELQNFKRMMSDELFYKKEGMYPKPLSNEDKERLVKKLYIKR